MGKKKFIDKKKAATFQLLARDSSDPNFDCTPGNDRIFVRVDNSTYSVDTFFDNNNEESDSIFADAPEDDDAGGEEDGLGRPSGPSLPDHVRREILELGFPDDGYNYLAHLREIKKAGGGSAFYHNPKFRLDELPRDVKAYDASRVKVKEVKSDANERSIYSVASKSVGVKVQRVVDPEVAALLDDSDLSRFGSDVEDLEEDFIVRANCVEDGVGVDADEKFDSVEEAEDDKYVGAGNQKNVIGERNQVTETGNVCVSDKPRARRPLDDQFDMLERQEYGTDSDDDYDGYIAEEEETLAEKLKTVLKDNVAGDLDLDDEYRVPADILHASETPKSKEQLESAADVIRRCVEYAEKYENENEDDQVVIMQESSDESEEWDCETIVSTYSNLDNHPGKIGAPEIARKKKLAQTMSGALSASNHVIALRGKEKLPIDFLPCCKKSSNEKVKDVDGLKSEQLMRKQHGKESKEEKKERKAAVKEERREARRTKKEMKGLYRSEAQHAQKVAAICGPSSIHLT